MSDLQENITVDQGSHEIAGTVKRYSWDPSTSPSEAMYLDGYQFLATITTDPRATLDPSPEIVSPDSPIIEPITSTAGGSIFKISDPATQKLRVYQKSLDGTQTLTEVFDLSGLIQQS